MSEVIQATKRTALGTGASRRLRKEGLTPAIIYGDKQEPIHIAVDQTKIFYALNKEDFHTQVLELDLEGKKYSVIARDFQMHPVKRQVQHLDFQAVDAKHPIKIKVPLKFVGAELSAAVKLNGASVYRIANSVEVLTLPKAIPHELVIDLKNIEAGQILHVSDIVFPEGVESVALKQGNNPPIVSASGKSKA